LRPDDERRRGSEGTHEQTADQEQNCVPEHAEEVRADEPRAPAEPVDELAPVENDGVGVKLDEKGDEEIRQNESDRDNTHDREQRGVEADDRRVDAGAGAAAHSGAHPPPIPAIDPPMITMIAPMNARNPKIMFTAREDEVAQQQRDVVRLPDRDQRPETSLAGDRLVGHAEQAALEEREDEDHHTERDERDRRREYRAGRLHEQVRELKTPKSAVMSSTIGFRTTPLTAGRRA